MFKYFVQSVLMYGAEVWGWVEKKEIEDVQVKYMKWVMGLRKGTPGYLVLQEGGANLLRIEAGRRAARFEERMMRPRNVVLREMFKEVTEGAGWGIEECAEEILGESRFGMGGSE